MHDKRLIDANAFLSAWHDWLHDDSDKRLFTHLIEDAQTINAVEVVRCRECKHSIAGVVSDDEKRMVRCTVFHDWIDRDGYCHRGAKMDGGVPHEENSHTL